MTNDDSPQNPAAIPQLFAGAIDAVQQKAVTSQRNAAEHDRDLGRGEVDPPYVTNPEPPPETMTHQQISDAAKSIDQAALSKLTQAWARSSVTITSMFQLHRMGVARVLQGRWEGASGEAAHAAAMRLAHAGEQMGKVAESAAFRLDAMYNAAVAFAAAVPPVPAASAPNPDNPRESVLPNLTSGEKDRADNEAAIAARKMAIDAVNRIYLPICPPSGENVPAFVPPPQIGGGDGGTGGGGQGISSGGLGSGAGGTGGGQGDPSRQGSGTQPGSQDPRQNQTTPAGVDPAITTPSSAGTGGPGAPGAATPGQPGSTGISTTPAGVSSAGLAGPGVGGGIGGKSPGIGGRGGSGSGTGPGGPGSSRPGTPGQTGPGAGQAAAAARAAGVGPGGPMGPMAPGAHGQRKGEDEDRTKPIPDYLKRVQPELADLPPAPTGAIGGDYATWQAPDSNTPPPRTSPAATSPAPGAPPVSNAGYEPPRTGTGVPIRYDDPAPAPPPPAAPGHAPAVSYQAPAAWPDPNAASTRPSPPGTNPAAAQDNPPRVQPAAAPGESSAGGGAEPRTETVSLQGPMMDDGPARETGR
ncbi:hypothetical protein [Nocardia transvalensis]|uniref:hypothetical protein n=1 Tax=Nocardia transvalensis TaxID=37333 RepID=UPI0018939991|nr:hypothetical protein [Nocardia transvalensis]MBF6333354.1 hypothetical protein [Nocardia transvalensis]